MNILLPWKKSLFFRHVWSGFLTLLLVLLSFNQAHADCKVKNENTGIVYTDLQVAINAASSGDTLSLKGKCETSIGFFITDKSLNIEGVSGSRGSKATLDGNNLATVLTIFESIPNTVFVRLENLKIRNGNGVTGGGINNNATLTLIHTDVVNNQALTAGGIFNLVDGNFSAGKLTLIHSKVNDNTSAEVGGGISSIGLVAKHAVVNSQTSEINHNIALGNGGGINAVNSNLFIDVNSEINHNQGANGGAIYNESSLTIIINSQLKSNQAALSGGGIYNVGLGIPGEESILVMESSKLDKNQAEDNGGGLYNDTAEATFIGSSVKKNRADNGGGIFNTAGSILNLLDNTIVIKNTPNDVIDL